VVQDGRVTGQSRPRARGAAGIASLATGEKQAVSLIHVRTPASITVYYPGAEQGLYSSTVNPGWSVASVVFPMLEVCRAEQLRA
jgi:hypothetical protein